MLNRERSCYCHFITATPATVESTVAVLHEIASELTASKHNSRSATNKSEPAKPKLSSPNLAPNSSHKVTILLLVDEVISKQLPLLEQEFSSGLASLTWCNRQGEIISRNSTSSALTSQVSGGSERRLDLTNAQLNLEFTLVTKTELNLLLGREFAYLILAADLLTLTQFQKITPCLKQGGDLHLIFSLLPAEKQEQRGNSSAPSLLDLAVKQYQDLTTPNKASTELGSWLALISESLTSMQAEESSQPRQSFFLDFRKLSQLPENKLAQLELLGFARDYLLPPAQNRSLSEISAQQQYFVSQVLNSLTQATPTKYFLLNSPRGTGKTYTLYQLIRQSLQQGGIRVLFCSHSKASFEQEFANEREHTNLEYCSVSDIRNRLEQIRKSRSDDQGEQAHTTSDKSKQADLSLRTLVIIDEAATQNSALLQQLLVQEEAYQALVLASTLIGYEGNSSGFSHIVLSQLTKQLLLKQQQAYLFSQPQGIRAIADDYERFFSPSSIETTELVKTILFNTIYRYRQELAQALWSQYQQSNPPLNNLATESLLGQESYTTDYWSPFQQFCTQTITYCYQQQVVTQVDGETTNQLASIFSSADQAILATMVSKLTSNHNLELATLDQKSASVKSQDNTAYYSAEQVVSDLIITKIAATDSKKLLAFQQVALRNHYNVKLESPQLYQLDYYQLYALEQAENAKIQGGIVLIRELLDHSLALKQDIIAGTKLPQGNLSAQQLIAQYGLFDYAQLQVTRISRIFLNPSWRGTTQSSKFLASVCQQEDTDLWTTSFGYHPKLLNFWLKEGFIPVALTRKRNKNSGRFNLLAIKQTEKTTLATELGSKFLFTLLVRYFSSITSLPQVNQEISENQPPKLQNHIFADFGKLLNRDQQLNLKKLLQSYLEIQELDQVTWQQELTNIAQFCQATEFFALQESAITQILTSDPTRTVYGSQQKEENHNLLPADHSLYAKLLRKLTAEQSSQAVTTTTTATRATTTYSDQAREKSHNINELMIFLLQASLDYLLQANNLRLLDWGLSTNLVKSGNRYLRYFDHWQNLHFSALLWQSIISRQERTELERLMKKLATPLEDFSELTKLITALNAYQQQVKATQTMIKEQLANQALITKLNFENKKLSSFAQANLQKQQRQALQISITAWQAYLKSIGQLIKELDSLKELDYNPLD